MQQEDTCRRQKLCSHAAEDNLEHVDLPALEAGLDGDGERLPVEPVAPEPGQGQE